MELNDIVDFLHTAARSAGAEVTSPWFYLQFGLMLAAGGIAFATDAAVRSRVDMTSFAMGWPLPLRQSKEYSNEACAAPIWLELRF